MTFLWKVFAIAALTLPQTLVAKCVEGSCVEHDETNLLQVKQVVKPARKRIAKKHKEPEPTSELMSEDSEKQEFNFEDADAEKQWEADENHWQNQETAAADSGKSLVEATMAADSGKSLMESEMKRDKALRSYLDSEEKNAAKEREKMDSDVKAAYEAEIESEKKKDKEFKKKMDDDMKRASEAKQALDNDMKTAYQANFAKARGEKKKQHKAAHDRELQLRNLDMPSAEVSAMLRSDSDGARVEKLWKDEEKENRRLRHRAAVAEAAVKKMEQAKEAFEERVYRKQQAGLLASTGRYDGELEGDMDAEDDMRAWQRGQDKEDDMRAWQRGQEPGAGNGYGEEPPRNLWANNGRAPRRNGPGPMFDSQREAADYVFGGNQQLPPSVMRRASLAIGTASPRMHAADMSEPYQGVKLASAGAMQLQDLEMPLDPDANPFNEPEEAYEPQQGNPWRQRRYGDMESQQYYPQRNQGPW